MNKVEQIADYLCNGYEHAKTEVEAVSHLQDEFGMSAWDAGGLLAAYMKKFGTNPAPPNDELFPFIKENLKLHKKARKK